MTCILVLLYSHSVGSLYIHTVEETIYNYIVYFSLNLHYIGFMHIVKRTTEHYPQFADNEDLQAEWREAKRRNKVKVASFLREKTGYIVNPDAMFDVQVILPS